MLFPTLEVRWFIRGNIPVEVREWFVQGDPAPIDEPPRVDHYLCLQRTNALGIKLREGRIEIKQRLRQYGNIRFHRRVTGVIEHWRKWSLPLAMAGESLAENLVPRSSWIDVRKERMLRGYRCDAEGQVAAIPGGYADRGCHLELTNVQAGDRVWWTLAFEAYGAEPSLRGSLVSTMGYILERDGAPCSLDARDSFGYARWLALLDQGRWE
jgi:hypothetical protein